MDTLIERLRAVQVSSLCDADKGLAVVDPAIRAMVPDVSFAGPAFTLLAYDDHLPCSSPCARRSRERCWSWRRTR